jgi:hypothetical protein
MPSLKLFSLVGGTALSLKYGHRSSIDLDMFLHEKFDVTSIETELKMIFGKEFSYESGHNNTGIFFVQSFNKLNVSRIIRLIEFVSIYIKESQKLIKVGGNYGTKAFS